MEARPTQVPLMAKQPLVMAIPLAPVVVPPVKVRDVATFKFVVVAFVVRSVVMMEDAELKFWRVDDDSAMSDVSVLAPAFRVLAPMLMEPKEPPMEPAVSAPTDVKEDARIPPPNVLPFNTCVPPIM